MNTRASLRTLIIPASAVYCLLLCLAVVLHNQSLLAVMAGIPLLTISLYLAFYQPYTFGLMLVLALPLSINLKDVSGGFGISIPAEFLVFLMGGIVFLNLLRGKYVDKKVLLHPVSIAIGLHLLWLAITGLSSTMPMVSLKFLLMRGLFILVFYLFFLKHFGNKRGIQQWVFVFVATLSVVIIVILMRHAQFDFIQQVNRYVAQPFFSDHTIYGSVVAMLIPLTAAMLFLPRGQRHISVRVNYLFLPLLLAGVFFSFSRAAWLSIVFIIPAVLVLKLKVRFGLILAGILFIMVASMALRGPIMEKMRSVESERGSNVREHAASVANINSSASNMERINRWESALAMFRKKPVLGFGPGTYPFQYAPYQREENLTRISTFFGDKGGAHSEYLKPLAETGFPGLLFFLFIIILTIRSALRVIYHNPDNTTRMLAAALLLGLITYYVHGFFNFFLDTDKTSALFWGMTSFIVALDIHQSRKQEANQIVITPVEGSG